VPLPVGSEPVERVACLGIPPPSLRRPFLACGGRDVPAPRPPLRIRQLVERYLAAPCRRAAIAMGSPTQKMWMTTPINIILIEKGYFVAAESGTTIRFMKK
jgi:hypothetical protein